MTRAQFFLTAIGMAAAAFALQSPAKTLVGTFEGFVQGEPRLKLRADDGSTVQVEAGPATEVRRVAPGEKSLRDAQVIPLTEIRPGDRLLISYAPSNSEARRIVVMAAADISGHNDVLQREWAERGVSGLAVSIKPGEMTVRRKSMNNETETLVVLTPATTYRRYKTGSNSYSEAEPSTFSQIRAGDQVRARGRKSPDGARIEAEEVVFGTFVTKAGTVLTADAATNLLTVRDLETDRPLPVRITPASQVKRFPEFPTAPAGMGGAPSTPGLQPSRPASGGPPDLAQMIERLPVLPVSAIKPGDTVVFSASPGTMRGELLAVVLLSNASTLVQMAQARNARQTQQPQGPMGMGGGMGAGGLDLSGFLP